MTLPYQTVLRWRPDALSTAADQLRRHVAALEAQAVRVGAARRSTGGHWHGTAAEAAQRRLQGAVATAEELVMSLESARKRLDGVADSLGYAQSRVRGMVDGAEASGFRLGADGTVHPPYLPPPGLGPSSGAASDYVAGFDARADQLLQEAAARTRELRTALLEAQLADAHQAATLRGLELPTALLGEVIRIEHTLPSLWATPTDAVVFPAGWEPWPAITRGSDRTWVELVTSSGSGCLPGQVVPEDGDPDDGGTGYYGGGWLTGPDGNRYPLVVPQVLREGTLYRANLDVGGPRVEDLMGSDPGWHRLGGTSGVGRFGHEASRLAKFVVGGAALAGLVPGPGTGLRRRNDLLTRVGVDGLGKGSLRAHEPPVPRAPGTGPDDPRTLPDDPPGVHTDRPGRVGSVLALVENAAAAATLVEHLEDHLTHGYTLSLQQNEDGRRRALLRLYDVYDDPEGRVEVRSSLGYVRAGGELGLAPATPLSSGYFFSQGPS